jgi:hypothetical protein
MACWPVGLLETDRGEAMKKYRVTLTAAERNELERRLARGKADVRRLRHAQVLLKADQAEGGPAWPDERIVAALDVGIATVQRLRQPRQRRCRVSRRACRPRLAPVASASASTSASSMASGVRSGAPHKLIALACSTPPDGRGRSTLRLLAGRMVERCGHEYVRNGVASP